MFVVFRFESPYITFYSLRRRVNTDVNTNNIGIASQQQAHPSHWSRRVTADNPHGFADKTLVRLRAIEDPAEREKEERMVLDQRRWAEKHRLNGENVARIRDKKNEKLRKQKINAGYVNLTAMDDMIKLALFSIQFIFPLHPQLPRSHTPV
jgi:hypothetical protein